MISIIGGGPAGSFAAYKLAKAGQDVDIYDARKEIGIPIQCTGIVTESITNLVKLKSDLIQNKIKQANIISPDDNEVSIRLNNPNIILNRTKFDQFLSNMAVDAGANLFTNCKLTNATKTKLSFKHDGETTTTSRFNDLLVGADGPNSIVRQSINPTYKMQFMFGVQAIIKTKLEDHILNFYPQPNGYAWLVPQGDGLARAGIAIHSNSKQHFQNFLKTKCDNPKILETQAGLIPNYDPELQIYNKELKTYLIGDAATQVKYTTGGGIIQSLIAGNALTKAITTKQSYPAICKLTLNKELYLHLKLRQLMDKFTDADYNKLIKLTNQTKIKNILAAHDRDYLTTFLLKIIMKEPRYLLYAKNLLKRSKFA